MGDSASGARATDWRQTIWAAAFAAAVGFGAASAAERAELQAPVQPGFVPTPQEELLPPELRPQAVFFRMSEPVGTIIVHTEERFPYLVQGDSRAIRYGVGVGREGFQWSGLVVRQAAQL